MKYNKIKCREIRQNPYRPTNRKRIYIFNNKDNNRVLKAENNGIPELDNLGETIVSEKRAAKSMYLSLDVGLFF